MAETENGRALPLLEPERLGAEPDFGSERELQASLEAVIRDLASTRQVELVMLSGFGLDIAVFVGNSVSRKTCFLEVKAFADNHGRCGFGHGKGGNQVWLFHDRHAQTAHTDGQMKMLDHNIRWILGYRSRPIHSRRFLFLKCSDVKTNAMAGIVPGKYNNLRLSGFDELWINWAQLVQQIEQFLFGE